MEYAAGLKARELGFCPDCAEAEDSDDEFSTGGVQPIDHFHRHRSGPREGTQKGHCKEHSALRSRFNRHGIPSDFYVDGDGNRVTKEGEPIKKVIGRGWYQKYRPSGHKSYEQYYYVDEDDVAVKPDGTPIDQSKRMRDNELFEGDTTPSGEPWYMLGPQESLQ